MIIKIDFCVINLVIEVKVINSHKKIRFTHSKNPQIMTKSIGNNINNAHNSINNNLK